MARIAGGLGALWMACVPLMTAVKILTLENFCCIVACRQNRSGQALLSLALDGIPWHVLSSIPSDHGGVALLSSWSIALLCRAHCDKYRPEVAPITNKHAPVATQGCRDAREEWTRPQHLRGSVHPSLQSLVCTITRDLWVVICLLCKSPGLRL